MHNDESKRNMDDNVAFHKNSLKKLVLFIKQQFSYKINKKIECIAEYACIQTHVLYIYIYIYKTLCIYSVFGK